MIDDDSYFVFLFVMMKKKKKTCSPCLGKTEATVFVRILKQVKTPDCILGFHYLLLNPPKHLPQFHQAMKAQKHVLFLKCFNVKIYRILFYLIWNGNTALSRKK